MQINDDNNNKKHQLQSITTQKRVQQPYFKLLKPFHPLKTLKKPGKNSKMQINDDNNNKKTSIAINNDTKKGSATLFQVAETFPPS